MALSTKFNSVDESHVGDESDEPLKTGERRAKSFRLDNEESKCSKMPESNVAMAVLATHGLLLTPMTMTKTQTLTIKKACQRRRAND